MTPKVEGLREFLSNAIEVLWNSFQPKNPLWISSWVAKLEDICV